MNQNNNNGTRLEKTTFRFFGADFIFSQRCIFACVLCFLSTPWAIKMRKEY